MKMSLRITLLEDLTLCQGCLIKGRRWTEEKGTGSVVFY